MMRLRSNALPALRLARQSMLRTRVAATAAPVFRRANANNTRATAADKASTPPGSNPPPNVGDQGGSDKTVPIILALIFGGVAYYGYNTYFGSGGDNNSPVLAGRKHSYEDYAKVYKAIADKLVEDDDYDDGSYGPVLVRLAWHASGTFDKKAHDGGSSLGTMRFEKEYNTDSNKGLINGVKFLAPIKEKFPWISYGDLYTLGGVCAIQEMSGPIIKWRPGRIDGEEGKIPPDGRLPDGSKGAGHVRDIFYRMGFNDQQIVALLGAHALGRCHTFNSGFDGPWTFSPTTFTNDFYQLLLNEKWQWRKWDGPKQYQDEGSKSLMMLPADMSLVQDKEFKKWVEKYAKDQDLFFKDFADAFSTLLELGVKFDSDSKHYEFKPVNA